MMATDKSALAGEYVLGTLPEAERRAVERALDRDPELAAAVGDWRARLAALDDIGPDVAPPAEVWEAIVERTGAATGDGDTAASAEIVQLRRRASVWRTSTLLTGLLAAGLAAVVIVGPRTTPVPAQERYVAAVDRGDDLPALLVDVDIARGRISVLSVTAEAPQGRSYELWYIGEGSDPRSLGLVEAPGAQQLISLSNLGGFEPHNAVFAISDEPAGGSPTGAPTGDVLFTGQLIPIPLSIEAIE